MLMKTFYIAVLLILMTLVSSCGSEEGVQTITIEGRYTLTIPAFLSEADDLHEDASLQYQNIFKDVYVLVIDEPKTALHDILDEFDYEETYSNDLDGYTQLILDGVIQNLNNPHQTDVVETTVNGLPARLTTLEGVIENMPIFYVYGLYESQESYYQVIVWTSVEKKSQYKPKMEAVLQTLNDITPGRKKRY